MNSQFEVCSVGNINNINGNTSNNRTPREAENNNIKNNNNSKIIKNQQSTRTSEAGRTDVNNQYYNYNYNYSQYQYHNPQYQQQQQQHQPPQQSYYPHQYPPQQQQPQPYPHHAYYQQHQPQHHQQLINNSYPPPQQQQQQDLQAKQQQLQYYGHSAHSSLSETPEQYNVSSHQLVQQQQPQPQQQEPQQQHPTQPESQDHPQQQQQQEQPPEQSQLQPLAQQQQQEPESQQKQQQQKQSSGEGSRCWECGSELQDVSGLKDHLAFCHPHVLPHQCHLCPALFPSQTTVNEHITACHVVGVAVRSPQTRKATETPPTPLAPENTTPEPREPRKKRARRVPQDPEEKENRKTELWCVQCRINNFKSHKEFEAHHLVHVRERTLSVRLNRLKPAQNWQAEARVDSGGKGSKSAIKLKLKISKVGRGRGRKRREVKIVGEEGMSDGQDSLQAEEGSQAESGEGEEEGGAGGENKEESGGDSGEEREAGGSSADLRDLDERQGEEDTAVGHDDEDSGGHDDYQPQGQESEFSQQNEEEEASPTQGDRVEDYRENREEGEDESEGSNSGYNAGFGFSEGEGGEGENQNYQEQFESFSSSDWFNEYESGPRIAAAMAGTTAAENAGEGDEAWPDGGEGTEHSSYPSANSPSEKGDEDPPVNGGQSEGDREDGLFSQAVLGQESPDKGDRQGSFEQLCLNDSFSARNEEDDDGSSQDQDRSQMASPQEQQQQQQQQASGVASDLLSELEYLNNSGQAQGSSHDSQPGSQAGSQSGQTDGSPHSGGPSPHSGGPATPSHLSSRGSNSGTPTSSGGHPTPPPSDTSFRALATSPLTSPTQQQSTSPSLHKGSTPPATSPQSMQHSPQPGGEGQSGSGPRLTIANNLMAATTSGHPLAATTTTSQSGVGMMGRYGSQWSQGSGFTGSGAYPTLPGTSMANANMASSLRAPMPPGVAMPYRPSPPPRVRGRPPLMGHVGRPPLHQAAHLQSSRGPGRPPNSSILPPPLMPAPGGRGTMMPPLQRMHQSMYPGQRAGAPQQQAPGAKRPMMGAGAHSPSKTARREDINVPSRQKDNECQIIAVANRSDGLPVISNVQGGSAAPGSRGAPAGAAPPTTESTINLSDSITLSVRASGSNKDGAGRGERGGPEAGAVANLLASRGITVTPAAGERQDGGNSRDDRRLPTAQELNLSSAISVHPPTQRDRESGGRERDRDGFAVPQAPPTRSSSNSSVERPPRPPTVDLTQDMPSSGPTGRHKCHQCDRSFPTVGLLSDHSRVHQQQQQSRMPFKCHLCTAGFSTQKGQQHHYQQFHQLHLAAGDVAIPLVDLRNPVNVQRMAALGIRSFLPITNLQNRGAGGVVGVPILTLENLRNGHMTLQQWGVSDVLSLGPAKTLNMPR